MAVAGWWMGEQWYSVYMQGQKVRVPECYGENANNFKTVSEQASHCFTVATG